MAKGCRKILKELSGIQTTVCCILSAVLIVGAILAALSVRNTKTYQLDFSCLKSGTDESGTSYIQLRGLSLRKGTYSISMGYKAAAPVDIDIAMDNDTHIHDEMPATADGFCPREYKCDLRTGTDRGRIDFTYSPEASLQLSYLIISSDKPLYYDGMITCIALLILIPCLWLGTFFYNKSTHKGSLLVAIGLVTIQIIPFIFQQELHMGVDTRAHMMRIEGLYYGLLDGQFPVIVFPEWANSYGELGILYPNVFLYIPALFRLFGMSQLGACKLHILLVIIISTLIALACARSIFKKEWQISLAVIIICLDNMRLLNLLDKGRIGGATLAEMFYPLVIAGLIEIFYQNKSKWYLIAYGMAGIFCCHVLSATIVCLGVLIFCLFQITKLRDPQIRASLKRAFILFTGLVFGPAIAFLKYYFSDWGKETLQWSDFTSRLWPMGDYSNDIKWAFIIVLIMIASVNLSMLIIRRRYDLLKGNYIIPAFICAVLLFWSSTAAFPWGLLRRISLIEYYTNMIQTAYRILSLASCFMAFCIPKLLEEIVLMKNKARSYDSRTFSLSFSVITLLCVISYASNYISFFYIQNEVLYYDALVGETEYSMEDYLPSGTQHEWYESDSGFISDEEAVNSLAYEREGTYIYYSYTNSADGAYVEFPRFYYDGYIARDEMADEVEVYKGDRNRTRVYLKTTMTPAIIRMWFHVPWYLTFVFAISLGLWVGSLIVLFARVYMRIDP